MYTLIPENEIKKLRREYRIRMFSIFFSMLTIAIFVGIVSLVPAYIETVFALNEKVNYLNNLKKESKDIDSHTIEKEIEEVNLFIEKIGINQSKSTFSSIAESIANDRSTSIRIISFNLSNNSTTTTELVMRGVSNTRDALIDFKRRLEQNPLVESVELPVSDLAKSKDISFSIKLITSF